MIKKVFIFIFGVPFYFVLQTLCVADEPILGEGKFNAEITNTANMIAFIQDKKNDYLIQPENSDIYLLNPNNGKRQHLTEDKYQYEELQWSPDGRNMLFTCRRNNDLGASFDASENPAYLAIYSFDSLEERLLENVIKNNVIKLGNTYYKGNKDFKWHTEDKYFNTSRISWLNNNRISFFRKFPFGIDRRIGDLCTTDLHGNNLKVFRDFKKPRKWFGGKIWLNEITLLFVHLLNEDKWDLVMVNTKNDSIIPQNYPQNDIYEIDDIFCISNNKKYLLCEESKFDTKINKQFNRMALYNLDTGIKRILMNDVFGACFSPDDSMIACIHGDHSGNNDIFLLDINGKIVKQLTFDGGRKSSIDWCSVK